MSSPHTPRRQTSPQAQPINKTAATPIPGKDAGVTAIPKETVAMADQHKRFRVWWIPQIPMKSFFVEVDDLASAVLLTEVLADYDAFQYENRVKPDYSNAGGVAKWNDEEGEWWDLDEYEIDERLGRLPA